jgi:hypothetical protein
MPARVRCPKLAFSVVRMDEKLYLYLCFSKGRDRGIGGSRASSIVLARLWFLETRITPQLNSIHQY